MDAAKHIVNGVARGHAAAALSPREIELLGLLADGCTRAEIAERLSVPIEGVRTDFAGIFGKLGVSNRMSAVARAIELGLIT